MSERGGVKAQVTIFIIIAIVIVAAVVLYFVLRDDSNTNDGIPASLQAPYAAFLSCLEDYSNIGISLLEAQGGYIELPDFEPGSPYSPFSNRLNFAGVNVPYWYYLSGNNLQKEQVPTQAQIEVQLANFVKERVGDCDLESFRENGFIISEEDANSRVSLKEGVVDVEVSMGMSIEKNGESVSVRNHQVSIKSELLGLYEMAKDIYNKEQSELFLEKYGEDVLRNYAPVDGVEVSCSPLSWSAEEVFDDLQEALEANTLAINSVNDKYFSSEKDVRFINSRQWPSKIEVNPSEGSLLLAEPVGNQPGMGILGFCYVNYHFVYDIYYPVLVQVGNDEVFQFPVSVILRANVPREPVSMPSSDGGVLDLCENRNTLARVNVYDVRSNPVDARVSYECAGTRCYIGEAENGFVEANFPQCVGGRVVVSADGFVKKSEEFSIVGQEVTNVYLNQLHPLEVRLNVDGKPYSGSAIITLFSNESVQTILYPTQKSIELSQGSYDVQVSVFQSSTLKLPATVREQCVDVPNGVLGVFGLTKKKCFTIEIPDQIISDALAGGGKQDYFVLDNELSNSRILNLDVESLPTPDTLEQLQINYALYEGRGIDIDLT